MVEHVLASFRKLLGKEVVGVVVKRKRQTLGEVVKNLVVATGTASWRLYLTVFAKLLLE